MAHANIFGGGTGWALGTSDDPLVSSVIAEVARQGEEFVDQKINQLAMSIRNQIAEAWNKGKKGNSAGTE